MYSTSPRFNTCSFATGRRSVWLDTRLTAGWSVRTTFLRSTISHTSNYNLQCTIVLDGIRKETLISGPSDPCDPATTKKAFLTTSLQQGNPLGCRRKGERHYSSQHCLMRFGKSAYKIED